MLVSFVFAFFLSFPLPSTDFGFGIDFPGGGAEKHFIGGSFFDLAIHFPLSRADIGPYLGIANLRGKKGVPHTVNFINGGFSLRAKALPFLRFEARAGYSYIVRSLEAGREKGSSFFYGLNAIITLGRTERVKFNLLLPYTIYEGKNKTLKLGGFGFGIMKKWGPGPG